MSANAASAECSARRWRFGPDEPEDVSTSTAGKRRRYSARIEPASELSPALYVDLVIAYRKDDQSPTLSNLLRVVREMTPVDHDGLPDDGELI